MTVSPTADNRSQQTTPVHPRWMTIVLVAAAAYNLIWGSLVIALPTTTLKWCGFTQPVVYPQLWQCIGMIVGVYGIGYGIAAFDSVRHWPIVLVGLLGKVFGPLGMAQNILAGDLPFSAARTILTNDLIWWLPFILILLHAWRQNRQPGSE